jgi:hypothetical protein
MRSGAGWAVLLAVVALAGCGESSAEKNRKAQQQSEKATRELRKSSSAAAIAEVESRIAQVEYEDAQAALRAAKAGRPAPAPHSLEIRRLRFYIRKARFEAQREGG